MTIEILIVLAGTVTILLNLLVSQLRAIEDDRSQWDRLQEADAMAHLAKARWYAERP